MLQPPNPELINIAINAFSQMSNSCVNLSADSSLIQCIETIVRDLRMGTADVRPAVLVARVDTITSGIQNNLSRQQFLVLSNEEASYYNNPNLFGELFKEKYSARALREALDAGNSYAASLYTACVFHCMRVAEYGLRKLACNRTLRVKITKKGHPCPIDYATWMEVITAIQNKLRKIRQRSVGPKREAELQFLSAAADHCDYMREIWRNELSHTRRSYNQEEAIAVIGRVKEFVIAVAEHRGSTAAEDSIVRLIEQADRT